MVERFGEMGIVTARPGVEGFPALMYVEETGTARRDEFRNVRFGRGRAR
jgi:hypothetical protein